MGLIIDKCWSKDPNRRPNFSDLLQSLKFLQEERFSGNSIGIIPAGVNLKSIGWCFRADRKKALELLMNQPVGSFVVRWSSNAGSYVVSYNKMTTDAEHIASIIPDVASGMYRILVDTKTNGKD